MKIHLSYWLLGAVMVFTACETAEEPENYTLETSTPQVVLSGTAGRASTVTVSASAPWTALPGSGYTVEPAAGDAGTTTVVLTPTAANPTRRHAALPELTFRIDGGRTSTPVKISQAPEQAAQTLLMYMGGMGNLVGAFDRNIVKSLKAIHADMPGEGRIVVFRQTGTQSAEISELFCDPATGQPVQVLLKSYDERLSSVDGPTMTRILTDMRTLAPADRYGLVMGSHATAWVPSTYLTLRSAAGDDYWRKAEGVPQTRSFGYDNLQTMDIPVLATSLRATGADYAYLIFDACFMSSIEALYDLRDAADCIAASPCEIMLYGFPYDETLPHLFLDQGRNYDMQGVCESFHNFYSTTTVTEKSGCIALTRCDQLEALAEVMHRIHEAGLQQYDPNLLQIYEGLSPNLFYDMGDFVMAACGDEGLRADFTAQFDRTFPPACRLHTPSFYTGYGGRHIPIERYWGVSISEPSTKYTPENQATAWYRATHP